MATTRLIPMHKIKNQSIAYTVHERIDYAINPAKTLGGELVMAYGCDPAIAANEMLLTKRVYADYTGRDIPENDVLLYQIRQSFKPGEITPEQAQQIGYELAMSCPIRSRHRRRVWQRLLLCKSISSTMPRPVRYMWPIGKPVTLRSEYGEELLIHVGMDTVDMDGKGFNVYVKEGDNVSFGQCIMKFSMDEIKKAGHPTTTAFVITNSSEYSEVNIKAGAHYNAKEVIGNIAANLPHFLACFF